MTARSVRQTAWNSLQGHWPVAILTALLAVLLTGGLSAIFQIDADALEAISAMNPALARKIAAWVAAMASIGSLYQLATFLLTGVITMGCASFFLKLLDGADVAVSDLFSCFGAFGKALVVQLLIALFTALWALPMMLTMGVGRGLTFSVIATGEDGLMIISVVLFLVSIPLAVFPIAAGYRYKMAFYILLENPEMGARQVIDRSKALMDGHKARLFRLELSFIGWILLGMLTLGIGLLFVQPYAMAAEAAFYRTLVPKKEGLPEYRPELLDEE